MKSLEECELYQSTLWAGFYGEAGYACYCPTSKMRRQLDRFFDRDRGTEVSMDSYCSERFPGFMRLGKEDDCVGRTICRLGVLQCFT